MWRMMRSRAGFTLAEMVAVVLVLGIVGAVAAPALRRPDEHGAGAAADSLRRVYAAARADAARRGEPVVVVLETATDSFAVIAEPDAGAPVPLRAGRLPLSSEGSIAGGRNGRAQARFLPTGRSRADRVTLMDGDVRREVAVDVWTGAPDHAAP
jgi:prepilin-type N-terminal cleavage/methylation domain-containing protein